MTQSVSPSMPLAVKEPEALCVCARVCVAKQSRRGCVRGPKCGRSEGGEDMLYASDIL